MEKLATFTTNNGQLDIDELIIDPKKFKIKKDAYFNGDKDYTKEEYSVIFREIAQWCNNNQGYVIDDWDGYYATRTTKEVEKLRYDALTEEEKEAKDKENHNKPLLEEIERLKNLMAENDYKQMKYIRGEYTDEEWKVVKNWFQTQALKIKELEGKLW